MDMETDMERVNPVVKTERKDMERKVAKAKRKVVEKESLTSSMNVTGKIPVGMRATPPGMKVGRETTFGPTKVGL